LNVDSSVFAVHPPKKKGEEKKEKRRQCTANRGDAT